MIIPKAAPTPPARDNADQLTEILKTKLVLQLEIAVKDGAIQEVKVEKAEIEKAEVAEVIGAEAVAQATTLYVRKPRFCFALNRQQGKLEI